MARPRNTARDGRQDGRVLRIRRQDAAQAAPFRVNAAGWA